MPKKVTKEALKPKAGDAFPLLAQTTLSAICPPAGFVAALLQVYLGNPASRRANDFLESIDVRLTKLEGNLILDKNSILNDPMFISIVMCATQAAIRTHQQEKLEALRNVVLNSASSSTLEEDKQLIFIRILDNLTAFDLKILNIIYSNEINKENFFDKLKPIFMENMISNELALQSLKFLNSHGLIDEELSAFGVLLCYNENNLGHEFLHFIKIPGVLNEP